MLAGAPHRDFTPSRLMVEKQTQYEAQNDVCSLWGEEGEVSLSRDRFRLRELPVGLPARVVSGLWASCTAISPAIISDAPPKKVTAEAVQ